MQDRTDSGILCFSTPHPNMDVPLNNITTKVHKYTKYEILKISCLFPIFQVVLPLCVLTGKVAVVKFHLGISLKCSQYRNTGPTDPSQVYT